jgi:hypothetical protein
MNLSGIIAIAGKPGLFKVVAQGNQSLIVESLLDKKRMAVHSRNKVSSLEDISIYTYTTDKPLSEIYSKIFEKENGGQCISHKASEQELRAYIETILEDYDQERVYLSDIKKLFNWYNLLQSNNLLIKEEVAEEQEHTEDAAEAKPKKKAAAPKKDVTKKAAPSKSTPKASASKAPTKKAPVQRKSS